MDLVENGTGCGGPATSSTSKRSAGARPGLSDLQQLSSGDLRAEWRKLFRTQPPKLSRDLIVRAIAYRMQELAHGGLPKATVRRLSALASEFRADGQISTDPGPQIKPGARLVREWRGRTHTVTVTEDGFEYAGRRYHSLTRIAREITGAHWSGPRFFGLVRKPADKREGMQVPAVRRISAPSVIAAAPAAIEARLD